MDGHLELSQAGEQLTGKFFNMGTECVIYDGRVDGLGLSFNSTLRTRTAVMMLRVEATFEGDEMNGMLKTPLGDSPFTATRT